MKVQVTITVDYEIEVKNMSEADAIYDNMMINGFDGRIDKVNYVVDTLHDLILGGAEIDIDMNSDPEDESDFD